MRFDLEDGKPPVCFVLKNEDAERFAEFMRECTATQERMDDATTQIERLREALTRASEWGGLGRNYDSDVRFDLFQWIEHGMAGPLPKMPRHLTPPNTK